MLGFVISTVGGIMIVIEMFFVLAYGFTDKENVKNTVFKISCGIIAVGIGLLMKHFNI